jgi:cation transport ATPase
VTRRVPPAILPGAALLFILAGLFLRLQPDLSGWSRSVWMAGLLLTGVPVAWRTLRGLLHGRAAADIVATLAIATAIPLGEPLAGLVVVLMQTGGEALERFAEGRASAAVRELEAAAPHEAHRLLPDGTVEDITAEEVAIDDLLLVRPGEMVPCDAVVTAGASHVDVSRLTGEPVPVSAGPGTRLPSGSVNGESPLTLRAVALASQSLYARIVELVRSAQAEKAPLQRLADRYAVWFTPLTLAVCVVAYLISSDPVRVLAVLVVATPCPLILATPAERSSNSVASRSPCSTRRAR